MAEPFIAEIRIFAGNFAPRGWAFCDGQLLPIAQHTALFSLIGTTYGGDGRTTTQLPDLRGRSPMHPGTGPGLTTRRLGQAGGTSTHPLSVSEMTAHNHEAAAVTSQATATKPADNLWAATTEATYATAGPPGSLVPMADGVVGDVGGSQPHNNRQPFLAINFIIALVGIYPSRN